MRPAVITVLGFLSSVALAQQAPVVSSIRVSGDAHVSTQPDRAQVDVGINTRAARSQDAATQNAKAVQAMLDAVRQAVPQAVLKTLSYSLNPNYEYHASGGEPTLNGYTASNVVRVTLDDLSKIGAVIDSATQAGANHVDGIHFTLRDEDAVRAQALREAALRARGEADVLAQALGLKVVRVLTVEESSPHVTPLFRPMARASAMSAAAAPTPVESGTIEVAADVTLTVEVSPAAR
jgi:uncharacterized protein